MKRYLRPLLLIEPAKSASANRAGSPSNLLMDQWVQLVLPPTPLSHDQAMLLNKQSEDEWLAWVPDYGEVTLHVSEFYFPHDWN
jgi:hypothetical protein